MKKTYIAPDTVVMQVALGHLMVVSLNQYGDVNSVSVSESEYDGNGEILGRRGSFWDDEE